MFLTQIDWSVFAFLFGWSSRYVWFGWLWIFINYAAVAGLIFVVGCYLWSLRTKRFLKHQAFLFALTAAVAYLMSRLIGLFYFRPRPFVSQAIDPLINVSPLTKSFPSSHALAAFALATLLYLLNRRLGKIALWLAALIALARVFVGVHYPSDVLVGAILGVLTAKIIMRQL